MALANSKKQTDCTKYNLLADASIELWHKSALLFKNDLTTAGTLAPYLNSDFSELEKGGVKYAPTEPVLQTFTLPIELNAVADLDKADKDSELELVFVFKPKAERVILLDDIAVTKQL